ncbi:hypothetical protein QYE76_031612 [Lolium multiflorum]|uniref:CCHC-type domain-containing protein n=1 Tax=Lolium multiflorum TaxID=4521 RepID=A0AAD8VIL9_LOLMU|nr:hypothetical protein QYE76_031612 [Lolium multiflorum]
MQALKVLEQNSHDSRNRAIGMSRGNNLALTVNSVEEVNPQEPYRTSWSMSYPEDLELHYNDHMAFHAKSFWVDPSKAKEDNIKRNNSSGSTSLGPRTRSCYNCGDKRHFIAQCPYEHRETNGGRLIPKDKSKDSKGKDSKAPNKKFYNKSKKGKRPDTSPTNPSNEIFSELDEINARVLFLHEASRSPKRRRSGATRDTKAARPKPWPRRPSVWAPVTPFDLPFHLLKASVAKPQTESHDTENLRDAAAANPISGDSGDRLRHPAGEGNHLPEDSSSP